MSVQRPGGSEFTELFLSSIGDYKAIIEPESADLGLPSEEVVLSVAALAIAGEGGRVSHGFIGGLDAEGGNPPKRIVESMYGDTTSKLGLAQMNVTDHRVMRQLFVQTAARAGKTIVSAYVIARFRQTDTLLDAVMFPSEMQERFPGAVRDAITEGLARGEKPADDDEARSLRMVAGMHASMAGLWVQQGVVSSLPSRQDFKSLARNYYAKAEGRERR